ncbi:MAG: PqqD family protein [Victivallaceae bacterium]|nr:PqqD family protein [Victivallaceae bacterium]
MKTDPLAVFCETPDGGGEIFSPEHSRPIRLNRTAAVVWNCFSCGKGNDSAVEEVLALFPGASPETVQKDVEFLIQVLKNQRLLHEKATRDIHRSNWKNNGE